MSKVERMYNPRERASIKDNRCRILDISISATKEHALCLRQTWHRVSAENKIMLNSILLTHHQHLLQDLPVGGQQDQVICVPKSTIPPASNVAT